MFDGDKVEVNNNFYRLKSIAQTFSGSTILNKASQVTDVESDGTGVQLRSGSRSGFFLSPVIDALVPSTWTDISTSFSHPVGADLPNGSVMETGYDQGAVAMTGNTLLLHLNEPDTATDDSIGKNITQLLGSTSFEINGKLRGSRTFDPSSSGRIRVGELKDGSASAISLSFWVKTAPGYNEDTAMVSVAAVNSQNTSQGESQFMIVRRPENLEIARDQADVTVGAEDDKRVNDGNWHHVAVTWNSSGDSNANNLFVYRDGVSVFTRADFKRAAFGLANPKYCVLVGGQPQNFTSNGYQCLEVESTRRFSGSLDEIAIFNRVLSADEVRKIYLRGATRSITSVRACETENCSDAFSTVGISGQMRAFFQLLSKRFFQYRIDLERDSISVASPRLKSIAVGPSHSVVVATLTSQVGRPFKTLESMREFVGPDHQGKIYYQLSPNGLHWYHAVGPRWEPSASDIQSNDAASLSAALVSYSRQFGAGQFFVKAILKATDESSIVELGAIEFQGNFNP